MRRGARLAAPHALHSGSGAAAAAAAAAAGHRGGVVLVVDDSAVLREFTGSALQAAGYTVLPMADTGAAMRRLRAGGVAAVLADADDESRLSSVELCAQLHEEGLVVPVIHCACKLRRTCRAHAACRLRFTASHTPPRLCPAPPTAVVAARDAVTEAAIAHFCTPNAGAWLLPKPFSREDVVDAVARVTAAAEASGEPAFHPAAALIRVVQRTEFVTRPRE